MPNFTGHSLIFDFGGEAEGGIRSAVAFGPPLGPVSWAGNLVHIDNVPERDCRIVCVATDAAGHLFSVIDLSWRDP